MGNRYSADEFVDRVAHILHDMKGGGPFGVEGSCECRTDAETLAAALAKPDSAHAKDEMDTRNDEAVNQEFGPAARAMLAYYCFACQWQEYAFNKYISGPCLARSPQVSGRFLCTRQRGHPGPHAACGRTYHNIMQWEGDYPIE